MTGYFDHNATTPLSQAAREAWLEAQREHWHNPSSLYREAGVVKRKIEEAREAFGEMFGCEPRRIVFNSGATEGCNAVMADTVRRGSQDARVLLSAIEHPSVVESARKWFGMSSIAELAVDATGVLDLERARKSILSNRPSLVSVMAANNETGVLQPWRELAEFCREQQVRFHCDAAQWPGKMPLAKMGACDWATISGHKFGGPKGAGLLIVPSETTGPLALQAGGPQESGHRGGTESYANIAALLASLQSEASGGSPAGRDAFERLLLEEIPDVRVLGSEADRLPNTSMVVMPAFNNLKWLTRLSERGFAVSTGSACSAGRGNPSHTMAAMGLDHDEMGRVLRFSGGCATGEEEWRSLAVALKEVWVALQRGNRPTTKINLSNL